MYSTNQQRLRGAAWDRQGIDVFFVRSELFVTGPVVAELATTGRIDIGAFYTHRAPRILPLLFAALLFALTVMSWLYARIDRAPFASTSSMVAFSANNLGFAQRALHYFSAGENPLLQRGLRPRYGSTDNHTLSPTTDHWLLPSVIGLPA